MICAACGATTPEAPCGACGGSPLLGEKYRLDEVIGKGASGTTYRGVELSQQWPIAVKEIPLRTSEKKRLELARREGEVLRQLRHPGVPSHLDELVAGTGKQRAFWLVQEFVHGKTLLQEMERKRYDEDEVLDVVEELIGILRYLHRLSPPVVHRDVKPANVIRRQPQNRLVLIDFGAVRDTLKEAAGSTVAGTFGYMAPEQFAGDAFPASDLYAVGTLAVHLLSRKDPREMSLRAGGLDWERHVEIRPSVAELVRGLLQPEPTSRLDHDAAVALVRSARKERERIRPKREAPLPPGAGNDLVRVGQVARAAAPPKAPQRAVVKAASRDAPAPGPGTALAVPTDRAVARDNGLIAALVTFTGVLVVATGGVAVLLSALTVAAWLVLGL